MTVAPETPGQFERVVLPFLDDAYTLARYLMRDEHDAQDVVQESFLRALRYYDRHPIDNARAWLLTIVRRTCYSWKSSDRAHAATEEFDESLHSPPGSSPDPAEHAVAVSRREQLLTALERIPAEFREVIILRELQELSYREISQVIDAPLGTVMSRLSRARLRLQAALAKREPAVG